MELHVAIETPHPTASAALDGTAIENCRRIKTP